uniref:LamG-like jellyroll fold domain-containing protein n=1 Tax=viral metagenome TaxID=1070528 RepID=A0A6C0AQN6_9ZZZZ
MSPLSIVITIVVIVLILMLLRYIFIDPYTLTSIQNGQTASTISASTLATNGSNIPSSNFAYSIWFYVNDWNYRYGEPKVIFGRMGALSNSGGGSIKGVSGLDPCPAVVLGAVENNIQISLGCFPGANQQPTTAGGNTVIHTCSVSNVPIQKWVNLVVSVYGRTMDVYIDGKLVRTCLLPGVASINNNADVHITPAGGFDGWTSKLQYYPNSINPQEVWNIYNKGYSNSLSLFGKYQVEISLVKNGNTESSVTI